ncbi:hypothetical protein NIES592_17695 [Fischerella major NIES-592]|uniref:DUF2231 domain-containing protein n=2 Tax=Fischerella TaxID=1190 RepID=A0A1U7GWW8_9CYAN|nr:MULTISPECIES: DUF2231 domain-containing protein [Fischerella]OKH12670.1 hypothetical protein NIES592_17695 [Fischerella major NIES-592]PMB41186.1 DUF2231 domain-containing protein [Fischerella thermalis CCMEE 5330]BAU05429.1 hypothetical protein FIS3754_13240 [Fischerella sp. NIES-3754]BCX07689.1 MAG: hypothetical protein KatS3mg066_1548 [Fischerella sp.]
MSETQERSSTPYPNIPAFLESDDREFRDTGVPSTVAVAGHPIHPILVQFPIAFLVGALLTDAVFWFTDDSFWARDSFWLIAAGLVGGVAAALTGLMDFLRIGRVRKRTAGWAHLILNVSALVLTIINLVLRWNNPISAVLPWGLVISVLVATLLGISGWYGGELVYRHKISVIGNGNPNQP